MLSVRKNCGFVILVFIALVILLCWGFSLWTNYNPLKKYGITYIIDSGEHEEYQTCTFYWDRDGKHIQGPTITGDTLALKFDHLNPGETPQIKVYTLGSEDTYYAILKLNFSDPTKPEFEWVSSHYLGPDYPPPWENYYAFKEDPETKILLPFHEERPQKPASAAP